MQDSITTMPMTVRMRRSPFFKRSHAAGAQAYIVYNNMLLATQFSSLEEDYRHLKTAVQIWDVGCERQIEIAGKDAARLVQLSTPRDISSLQDDQCLYIPTVDQQGYMTNDPVLLRVGEDRFWVSIADSDLMLFYKGLAAGLKLDVRIHEPEVSPLGIQGPGAGVLVARVWGNDATKLGFFRHCRVEVGGKKMILARSGYSVQGGYELYFEGAEGGDELWDLLISEGQDLDVRAGAPNLSERVEGGLLSYLSDITPDMTPYEAGLGRFCHIDRNIDCIALDALRIRQTPMRQIRAIKISGDQIPPLTGFWRVTDASGNTVGRISSAARAYSYNYNLGIGLIDQSHWDAGTNLMVETSEDVRAAEVLPGFPGRSK